MDPRRPSQVPDQSFSSNSSVQPYVVTSNLHTLGTQNMMPGYPNRGPGHVQIGMPAQQQQHHHSQMYYQPQPGIITNQFTHYNSTAGGMPPTPVYSDISYTPQYHANQNSVNYAASLGGAVPETTTSQQQATQHNSQNYVSSPSVARPSVVQNLSFPPNDRHSGGIIGQQVQTDQLPSNGHLPSPSSGISSHQ
eukprot:14447158-Ditylum_brightwellii.AAC.1